MDTSLYYLRQEEDRARTAHATFYLEFAERGVPGPWEVEQVAWLDRHLARLAASADMFGLACDDAAVRAAVAAAVGTAEDVLRVRLTLGPDGLDVRAAPLDGAPFETVWLCPDPLVEAGSPLCRHKTTRRAHYEAPFERARALGADEALLVNADGELVEGSRTSLWVRQDGEWLTPRLAAGGLPGVARAVLLATLPRAHEARLEPADLLNADALAVSNALRGLCPVRLLREPPWPAAPLAEP